MSDHDATDATDAQVQTHQQLQRLYLLLAEKGILTDDELAYVTGEGPKPPDTGIGTTSEPW